MPPTAPPIEYSGPTWEQNGGGPGSNGYVDLPPLSLPLQQVCSWSASAGGEVGAVMPVTHPAGEVRLLEFWTNCAGWYDCPWKVDPHQTAFFGRTRDPETCEIIANGGAPSAVTATYQGIWPDWFTYRTAGGLTRTMGRWWEGGLGYALMSNPKSLQLGLVSSYAEQWAHCQHSNKLGLMACESHWGWHGQSHAWLGWSRLDDPTKWTQAWSGMAWHVGVTDKDLDDVIGQVAIAEADPPSVVANMQFNRADREDGLYVYDITTRARRCFVPGYFGAPAVAPDGRFAYVILGHQVLLEIDTATCAVRDYPLANNSPWDSPPVVAGDMLYTIETTLRPDDHRERGDVVGYRRSDLAPAWRQVAGVLYPQETTAYWFRSDATQMAADQGLLYVGGRDGLLALDRHTGEVLDEVHHPSAPEGFARLVRWGDRIAATNRFAYLQTPLCQAELCAKPATSPRVSDDVCCRNLNPKCRDRSSGCDWWNTDPNRYRVQQSNFAAVWGGAR